MTRAAVNQIIQRSLAEPAFAALLRADPSTALAGYELSEQEHKQFVDAAGANQGGLTGGVDERVTRQRASLPGSLLH